MKRPWQVWLVFAVCAVGAAVAMVWLTRQALQADRLRAVAESEAELEQRVSLGLWRMDTALAPMVAEEVIRPASAYQDGSPLTTATPPYVVLHFEARPDGRWHTPQASRAAILLELSQAVTLPKLIAELPKTPLPAVMLADNRFRRQQMPATGQEQDPFGEPEQFFEGNRANAPPHEPKPDQASDVFAGKDSYPIGKSPKVTKEADFEKRSERYQSAARQNLLNTQQQQRAVPPNAQSPFQSAGNDNANDASTEQVGVSRPVWVGNRLLLARRAGLNGGTVVQGCWLDWAQIKARLLTEVADLLPDADLVPMNGQSSQDPGRMLAGLPVRLVVNETAVAGGVGPTLRWALWLGWGAVLLATAAAAGLLHGVMKLSERRAAFVSSVTHELRTPLTTFRMYSEMLARGMVPDAARRQEYFNTLQREAERLTLLVENVLAYARLERGRKPHAAERVTLAALWDRIGPRLCQRAGQAGMECVVESCDKTPSPYPLPAGEGSVASPCPLPEREGLEQEFTTDLNVVEQILFNLVDNAAKYARNATDRRIHVDAARDGRWVRLAVCDHGPGIEARQTSRPMRAFGKSAEESAESAPGVGLGLALCGRLARQLGGRLEIGATPGGGATVTLLLPAA